MRVLIGCESSGVVRRAFRALGHDAWSADLLPADDSSPYHIQGDVLAILGDGWDLALLHPPCTYINSAGLHWITRGRIEKDGRSRLEHQKEALEFVAKCMNAPIKKLALENPIGCISRRLGQIVTGGAWVVKEWSQRATCPPTQIIQPFNFGEDASKATCLWLKNLPPLVETKFVPPRMVCECGAVYGYERAAKLGCPSCGAEPGRAKPRWGNQTDSGQNKLTPSDDRWKERSRTYDGIAAAMAAQWSVERKNDLFG